MSMAVPLLLIALGCVGLFMGLLQFRHLRGRTGDFSEWIVSDATKLTRRLWIANAGTTMVVLLVLGPLCVAAGVWLMLKN